MKQGETEEVWDVHWDFMKPYNKDWAMYTDVPLYYHKSTTHTSLIDEDYDMVDQIIKHFLMVMETLHSMSNGSKRGTKHGKQPPALYKHAPKNSWHVSVKMI